MPRAVYVLAMGIFAMVTSEFVVAGLMPQMADGLDVTIPQIGYLITTFAVAMAVGGPFLTIALMRLRPKPALLLIFAIFLAGNLLAATATSYSVMLVARVVTGIAAQAFFGVAISVCSALTREEVRGRAIGVAMNGLMLGTLLGLPLATFIGGNLGWRAAFWAITVLTLIAAAATLWGVPQLERPGSGGGTFREEIKVFRLPRLWLVLSTSTFIIGATFAAFSYFNPILTDVSGFSESTVPLLLLAYGAATVVGNMIVGRLADRFTISVQIVGLALNAVFLSCFALFAELSVAAVVFMMGIGLVGVTMNPAMATRVQRTGNPGPLVNTVHSSFITLGIIVGSSVGGVLVDNIGLRAPLWLGAGLAVLGLVSLLPEIGRRAAAPRPAAEPVAVPDAPVTAKLREEV
ncbi:MFS transporter [Streptomyces microflavus]|uniref:MFS transporter n=1 Tax=Streptomyces microflavus TaxID=1919 RepID=A0A6N9V910_STRMI|nr:MULTISPECIES: MFS transporter [Streptomyces]MBW3361762.1 MFS transporter [Streptomyces sp. 09ZI22]MEE1728032.1 MFS transporter [Streptomyces sp. BE282]NEB68967.1 MFS transporter [Streptomyces microflavus]OXY95978.1 MFS transporter [Streptomyces sp. 2R]QKW45994.1 MFS transporter [Streptomyces microflavus]